MKNRNAVLPIVGRELDVPATRRTPLGLTALRANLERTAEKARLRTIPLRDELAITQLGVRWYMESPQLQDLPPNKVEDRLLDAIAKVEPSGNSFSKVEVPYSLVYKRTASAPRTIVSARVFDPGDLEFPLFADRNAFRIELGLEPEEPPVDFSGEDVPYWDVAMIAFRQDVSELGQIGINLKRGEDVPSGTVSVGGLALFHTPVFL